MFDKCFLLNFLINCTFLFDVNKDFFLQNHDKWKYPVNSKVGTPPNSMSYIGASSTMPGLYDLGQNKSVPSEHLVYMSNQIPGGMHMHPQYLQQPLTPQIQMRQGPVSAICL